MDVPQASDTRMIEILRKMFEANPGKSNIQIKENCSDCGCEVIIDITSTSRGFGLQGGALFKSTLGAYFAKCPDCYKVKPENSWSTAQGASLKPTNEGFETALKR